MNIEIYSRTEMERRLQEGPLHDTAVISFYNPPSPRTPKSYEPPEYGASCPALFSVGVHDIDPETLPEYGLTFDTYFPEAHSLAQFIKDSIKRNLTIVCQCDYGQSRSAACAAAILEYYEHNGISVFADYRYYPNQLIFNKLLAALCSVNSKENQR